jgi:hypothetical protein
VIFEWDAETACSSRIASAAIESESSALELQRRGSGSNMKKRSPKPDGELRKEYDLSTLKGRVQGKYHARATAGSNLVLIEPDLATLFPDTASVNRALRLLADTAKLATTRKRRT